MDTRIPVDSIPTTTQPLWKTIALYIVKAFHLACSVLVLVGPYLTNDVFYLTLLVFYSAGTYFFWYILGYCIFTWLEEYLGEPRAVYEDGVKKSFITIMLQSIGLHESVISNALIILPAISVFVCMYKINVQYRHVLNQLPKPTEDTVQ